MKPCASPTLDLLVLSDAADARLSQVARLDRELFGPHAALGEEALRELVARGGVVFAHLDDDGQVVTEAALMMRFNPQGPSQLERQLPNWLGYCDGAAVSPPYRGRRLQQQLLQLREDVARARGLRGLCASVRHNNVASIRAMLRRGFLIMVDAPRHFGTRPRDARIIMVKLFDVAPKASVSPAQDDDADRLPGFTPLEQVTEQVAAGSASIMLHLQHDESPDPLLAEAMASLLRAAYLGVDARDVVDARKQRGCALRFARPAPFNEPARTLLMDAQRELQNVVDS